jgi:hypothetical protein
MSKFLYDSDDCNPSTIVDSRSFPLDKCLNSANDDYNYYAHDDYLVEANEGFTVSEFHCARDADDVPYPEGWIVQEYV